MHRSSSRWAWFLSWVTVLLVAPAAHADSTRLPIRYVDRPLVLPEGTLRLDANLHYVFIDDASDRVLLDLGGAGGIAPDWELGTQLIPLQLAPDTDYRDPLFYGVYRFQSGQVEPGILAALWLPIDGDLALEAGPPLLVRLGNFARLDTGAFLRITFAEDTRFDVRIPAALAFQASPQLFLGPELALWFPEFEDAHLMLGGFVGYSLAPNGPLLADLVGHLQFEDALGGADVVRLLITADFYFDV